MSQTARGEGQRQLLLDKRLMIKDSEDDNRNGETASGGHRTPSSFYPRSLEHLGVLTPHVPKARSYTGVGCWLLVL